MWKMAVFVALNLVILSSVRPSVVTPDVRIQVQSSAFSLLIPPQKHNSFHGGYVAFIRTPTEIAVAADSLAVAIDDPSITRSACRIIQIGRSNLFIAAAGLDPQATGVLNQVAIVTRAHMANKTILATANAFAQSATGPLVLELERQKSDSPENYARYFEGKTVISMIFCGFEKHIPVVSQREFSAFTAPDGKISIRVDSMDCPGPLCEAGGMGGGVLRERTMGSAATDSGSGPFKGTDAPESAARSLVQRQIDDQAGSRSPKAGGPVDVLRITSLRANWVEHKEHCGSLFPYWRNGFDGTSKE